MKHETHFTGLFGKYIQSGDEIWSFSAILQKKISYQKILGKMLQRHQMPKHET